MRRMYFRRSAAGWDGCGAESGEAAVSVVQSSLEFAVRRGGCVSPSCLALASFLGTSDTEQVSASRARFRFELSGGLIQRAKIQRQKGSISNN